MKMREWQTISLCGVTLLNGLLSPANAQDVSLRLSRMRAEAALRHIAADLPSPGTGGTQSGEVKATPSASGQTTGNPNEGGVTATYSRRPLNVSVGGRMGFDKQTIVIGTPAVAGTIRRRIRTLDVSLDYPLSPRSSVFLTVPYIEQRTSLRSSLGNGIASGRGLGDIGIYLQQRFPGVGRGTDLSATLGLVTPTGKDPFNLAPGQLPTGVGFYQPVLRLTLQKLRVPLMFYGAVDYGTSLSRRVGGTKVDLPDSYGGEVGFYYTFSPEFTSQTSLSLSKLTSPFIDVPGTTVGYLSQSLTYQANQRLSWRGAVDVGLTEDSTDAYFGLSVNSTF